MSPLLVPIISPSSGVKPIDVSMHLPSLTAEMLDPLPRWHMMMRLCSAPRNFTASSLTNLWLVPWKPYLRTLYC